MTSYIPTVINHFNADKKGYNFRMCCLSSLAAVMPYIQRDEVAEQVIPIFVKATRDEIPNVKFCVSKIIYEQRQHIDPNIFQTHL